MAIVRGINNQGDEVFYTGKAGPAWVSENISEAFEYELLPPAIRKAMHFNKTTELHGVRFIGMLTDAEHASPMDECVDVAR